MREAHAHLAMMGAELAALRLEACESCAHCLELLREHAAMLERDDPAGTRWCVATGARVEAWSDRRWPTRRELDAICPERPAYVMSFDHHALSASTRAFAAAGIADNAPDPDGGVIERDSAGVPSGLLLESAAWMVRRAEPQPEGNERERVVLAALGELSRLGYTQAHDLLAPAWLGETLARLHDRGELAVRVGLFAPIDELGTQHGASRDWTRRGAVELLGGKVFVDGTLNSATAWMLEPFAHPMPDHPRGTPLLRAAEIASAITRCAERGLTLAAHAIGDAAVRAVLDATEATGARGVRIEHAEIVHPDDVPRFAELGAIASVQPCHLLYDVEALRRQIPDRLSRVMPLRDLLQSGLVPGETLIFGSDAPIVRADPSDSLSAAVQRRRVEGSPGGGPTEAIGAEQALTDDEALRCFLWTSPGNLG
jgi:hypothetical protein